MLTFEDKNIEEILACPICKAQMSVLREGSGILRCRGQKPHSYDFASGGYVNLCAPGQSGGGDSKQAVRARSDFLDLGLYAPIRDRLCEILKNNFADPEGRVIVDAGCGEGYYTSAVAECGFSVAGFDISKFAADAAAKRARRAELSNALFGVASVFTLPLADASADAVVNIFAPCVENEYSRVLKDSGILVVVHAGPDHLFGLKKAIYKQVHQNETRADLPEGLKKIDSSRLKYDITVNTNQAIKSLFAMTPYYWKTSQEDVSKLDGIETLNTEIDIIFDIYKKS